MMMKKNKRFFDFAVGETQEAGGSFPPHQKRERFGLFKQNIALSSISNYFNRLRGFLGGAFEGRLCMTGLIFKLFFYSLFSFAVIGYPSGASAAAAAAAGGGGNIGKWLFEKKIIGGPPHTYHGCVLGPLAIANAISNLKMRSSLKRTASQLKGANKAASARALAGGQKSDPDSHSDPLRPYYTTSPSGEMIWNIPPVDIPCLDGSSGCALTNNGETWTNYSSGLSMPVADLQARLPPETEAERQAVVEAVLKHPDIQGVIARANTAGQDASASGATVAANSARSSPAFNYDPLGGSGRRSDTGGSGAFAGSSPVSGGGLGLDSGGNTPELAAGPADLYGSAEGSGAGAFAGGSMNSDEEYFGGNDNENSGSSSFSGSRFGYSAGSSSGGAGGGNTPPLAFGDDKIAPADTDMFGAIRHRYNAFRTDKQFIPPSSNGAVVRPLLPSSPAFSGSGGGGSE